MTWRDVLVFDQTWTPAGLARATAAVEKADPFLGLSRVPVKVSVRWRDYRSESDGLSNAHSGVDWIEMNAGEMDQANSSWEEALIHELVHIVDKNVLPQSARDAVMGMLSGPVTPVWWDSPVYENRVGELFAETSARWIWYSDPCPSGMYGPYTFPANGAPAIAAHLLDAAPPPAPTPVPASPGTTTPTPTPKPATGGTVQLSGIDVSGSYQTAAQVTAAVKAGAKFVIVKASEGQHTAGVRHSDLVTAARQAGALVGHYHYAWADNDPKVEAANFLAQAQPNPGDLLVLDLEEAKDGESWSGRLEYALTWLETVKYRTGASPILYVSKSWETGLLGAATAAQRTEITSFPLWIADPSDPAGKPSITGWGCWTLDQFGIVGGLDRDVFNGDAAVWQKLAVPAKTGVEAVPSSPPVRVPTVNGGSVLVQHVTVPVVFTGKQTATAKVTFAGFKGAPEVLVTPGSPNYKAASYGRTSNSAVVELKCDWESSHSTIYCSVLIVGEPA